MEKNASYITRHICEEAETVEKLAEGQAAVFAKPMVHFVNFRKRL